MRLTRRTFLGAASALAFSSAAFPSIARAANRPHSPGKPRALVQIFLRGGLDAVLTTDPKTKGNVAPNIDLPYSEREIVTSPHASVGPLFRELGPYLSRLAILNGVVGSTVSHETGEENIVEMRRTFPVPSSSGNRHGGFGLVGTLGAIRGGDTPVSDVRLNYNFDPPSGRSLIANGNFLSRLAGLATHPQRSVMDVALRNSSAIASRATTESYDVVRSLLTRWPMEALPHPTEKLPAEWATIMRDTLYLLKHRLTPCVFIYAPRQGAGLDSHVDNMQNQTYWSSDFVRAFAYLLEELANRNAIDGAPLVDEVGVVVSSELGRFPVINAFNGKDHFPEFPVIFSGPGLKTGQYGDTDKTMIASPISPQTGHSRSSVRDFVPTLDDVGKTIFDWFGVEDTASIGYVGRRLDFLLA